MGWQEIFNNIDRAGTEVRLRLVVRGRVQGVGFRPGVYRSAAEAGVSGFVLNTGSGVVIEIEGNGPSIEEFGRLLIEEAPPLARIDSIEPERIAVTGQPGFVIAESEGGTSRDALFPVDTAVCEDCLRELADPSDPRFRYPFINCTNCGPRFTIINGLPYDRDLTTMRRFTMDRLCGSQYADPGDRRFHAEPISCPGCGPVLSLIDSGGKVIPGDPIDEGRKILADGGILAVKGLGGYHLACLAKDEKAVQLLRDRKNRPVKPFAIMFSSMETVLRYCYADEEEARLLASPEAPIVLLKSRQSGLPAAIAPGNAYTGAFLPYTPLHHLLIEGFDLLVMTSANFTDEPLISREDELPGILGRIADAALTNDREIAHKCDDSIFFVPGRTVIPLRRARGFVPEPVILPQYHDRCVLATGGQEKGTFTLTRGDRAFVSSHLGDLGDIRGQENFKRELESFCAILGVSPEVVVSDLHPDYFTTRFADAYDCSSRISVQHHHAHAVSVMVEYGLAGPVIGVSFDGTGYGSDGNLWGGEFLLASYHDFRRLAHLKYVPLPGGAVAVREPWRMALVYLRELFGEKAASMELPGFSFEGLPAQQVLGMVSRMINTHMTSSAGRLFDAAAALLGLGTKVSYEAQAAIALESLALEASDPERRYSFDISAGEPALIDGAPVIRGIVDDLKGGRSGRDIAAAFHLSVADMIVEMAMKLAAENGCREVVLSGGVFQNRLLCENIMKSSASSPASFHFHRIVPPNDGGVSLGQAQVGIAKMIKGITGDGNVSPISNEGDLR
ncbi:MAG: carbamoyltransferase HypF [Candidatus Krumholzibacteria bacterium]|nr:carbamoyltransferase HypF [Candidatus Krumholzibacteria bacterium]